MLEALDLQCVRGGRILFRGLSFALRGGELLRLAGANGSGKTSLLRILCGLLSPSAGEVRWQGEGIHSLKEEYSKRLLYLGHAAALKDELTPAENLRVACSLAGMKIGPDKVGDMLEQFGVPGGRIFSRQLSQGQRRRASLARLIASSSIPLWLLDEPFAALDQRAAETLEVLITAHIARGAAVVYTTHQEARLQGRVISLDA